MYSRIIMILLGLLISNITLATSNRYIIVHNDMPNVIYPVVESPENGNCKPKSTAVQRIVLPNGVNSGKTLKIYMPDKCWYNAGRVLIFTPDILAFEKKIDSTQQTQKGSQATCVTVNPDGSDGQSVECYMGIAKASYPLDSPAQLTEYTFDADDPNTGKPSPDPDKGRLMTDIDISYVDETFLPVAMAIDTGGLAGYMGTTLGYSEFKQRVDQFLPHANWSIFASYTKSNWPNNVFHDLIPYAHHTMGGYNLLNSVNTKATSGLYKATSGDAYLIENLTVNDQYQPSNPSVKALVEKWQQWLAPNNPCRDPAFLINPAVDKKAFCQEFQATVQWVWKAYQDFQAKDPDYCKFVGGDSKSYELDETVCLMEHIIGYTEGPNGGQLPESVQAILRSVPWNKNAPQYQYDKWLLFWAPFDSPYNLNPFARLIHDPKEGIDAVAYSFSIDDKYGNFRDEGLGFIINVGGNTYLPNKTPYDPYQQYFVTWPANSFDHAVVGGRSITINKRAGNSRVSMWKEGKPQDYCDVIMYTTAENDQHLNFRLTLEKMRIVTDSYTGISHQVQGLATDVVYCQKNSSPSLAPYCAQANLAPVLQGDIAYVSLSDNEKPKTSLNLAALVVGTRLNLAPGWQSASGCGLPESASKIDPTKGSSFPFNPAQSICEATVSAGANQSVHLQLSFDNEGNLNTQNFHCTKTSNQQSCINVALDMHDVNLPIPSAI